ncbi:FecR family protein [Brevundimonas abyssalis]|uniref:FecR family protein n=1 Tax=Brevundimonas abyssalis TaxID=1125965 RepID=UPI0005EC6FC8|nr:FecR domain-containing protein [Brevundimonas abyssalis]
MAGPTVRVEAAEEEAAAWHARLGSTVVATKTIEEFFEWRSRPGNADAYARVDRVWRESQGLGGDPQIAEALQEARGRRNRRPGRSRRSVVFGGAAALTALALVVGGTLWWSARGVHETAVGERRDIRLADGSLVNLDTDSRIRVVFDQQGRRVELLEGQALFDVTPDPQRPFSVEAAGARVVAVGTVFEVRRRGERVDVTLVSGRVNVQGGQGGGIQPLEPGQQARVSESRVETRAVDAAVETSWTTGRLIFQNVPLGQAVEEMNRYLAEGIVIDDPGIRDEAISGVFRTGDRDAFVAASSDVLGLSVVPKADGAVGLSRRRN